MMVCKSAFIIASLSALAAGSSLRGSRHSRAHSRHERSLARRAGLFSGSGDLTFYYDIDGAGTCGAANGIMSFAETNGIAMCEPSVGYKTLAERGSNNVVAIPYNMLEGNQAKYCGKEVSVTFNGKTIDNLIVWDGCAACSSNGGIDVSSTMFGDILGKENCGKGRIDGLEWKILDRQIWSYPSGDVVSGEQHGSDRPSTLAEGTVRPTSSAAPKGPEMEKKATATKEKTTQATALAPAKHLNLAVTASEHTTSTKRAKASKATKIKSDKPASATRKATSSKNCDDTPGEWRCKGKQIQQCIQVPDGFEWSRRLTCDVAPINCDTDNPVCPGEAST